MLCIWLALGVPRGLANAFENFPTFARFTDPERFGEFSTILLLTVMCSAYSVCTALESLIFLDLIATDL